MKRVLLFPLLVFRMIAGAQAPGSMDLSFNPGDLGHGTGDGSLFAVKTSARQADGRTLIGGMFTNVNGYARGYMARLEPNGMLDLSFIPSFNAEVSAIMVQPDGRILVGGSFTSYAGSPCPSLVRLEANGMLDPVFNISAGPDFPAVYSVALQANGKIMVAGMFASWSGVPRPGLVRLNADGTVDAGFVPGLDPSASFSRVVVQADQKILASGLYSILGATHVSVVRFLANGAVDPSFSVQIGAPMGIGDIVPLADGRILLSGAFTTVNSTPVGRLTRLNSDGSIDPGFTLGTGFNGPVHALARRSDGKLMVAGNFSEVSGQARAGLARLEVNGALDNTFDPGTGTDLPVLTLLVHASGVFIGGEFTTFNGGCFRSFGQLTPTGLVDGTYGPPGGINGASVGSIAPTVRAMLTLPDGSVLVGGAEFAAYGGHAVRGLFRILPNGSLDPAFNAPSSMGAVFCMARQPDGRVLLGGSFTSYNGVARNRIVRIMPDGTLDLTFDPGTGASGNVQAIALQADGKVLIGGDFTSVNGTTRTRLARLLADGSLDGTFTATAGNTVHALAIQPDGHILVCGAFTNVNGSSRNRIVRLLPDGSLDASFAIGTGASNRVRCLHVYPDGRVLAAGDFSSYQGVPRTNVMRLLSDGSLDATFDPGPGAITGGIPAMAIQPGGRILIGGGFTSVGGVARARIARLLPTGALDTTFDPGTGAARSVDAFALLPGGDVIVGGTFLAMNEIGRNRIARLFAGTGTPPLLVQARAHLGGAYDGGTGSMQDQLRAAALLPINEPYTALGYMHVGGGGEQTTPPVLTITGNNAIVDWVVVELRDAGDPGNVLATRSALVQRDGDVVDVDGTSPVSFGVPFGSYHVAIRHRNHLGVMTAAPIALSGTPGTVDLTTPAIVTYGIDARRNAGGTMVLWPGDVNADGVVKYTGSTNDRDPILVAIGGSTPTNTLSNVYNARDVNMDGTVKYSGIGNDRDIILQTIGGVVPTNTRVQQLP
ncbi:MAG: delta-60 repeat domain-containing protein [Flavobacteriales bacterium]|nr:delta-60 repeat domain-containing protein [Flavobacteriales bacterium]